MKSKIIKIVLILLCIVLVTGCKKKNSSDNQETEIRFKAHPEVQYTWYWGYKKGSDEEVIAFTKSEFEEFENGEDKEGYTGEQVYAVKGLKEGKTSIIFYTYQGDGNETHPKEKYTYEFTVDKNLKVKFKKVK